MRTEKEKRSNDLTALVILAAAVCCLGPLVILFLLAGGLSSILGVFVNSPHFIAGGILFFMIALAWVSYKFYSNRKEVRQKWES